MDVVDGLGYVLGMGLAGWTVEGEGEKITKDEPWNVCLDVR